LLVVVLERMVRMMMMMRLVRLSFSLVRRPPPVWNTGRVVHCEIQEHCDQYGGVGSRCRACKGQAFFFWCFAMMTLPNPYVRVCAPPEEGWQVAREGEWKGRRGQGGKWLAAWLPFIAFVTIL